MQTQVPGCPSPSSLKAWVQESAVPGDARALELHVENCLHCQQVLESLTAERDSWSPAWDALRSEAAEVPAEVLSRIRNAMPHQEAPPAGERLLPTRLGNYQVLAVVGTGGMGEVYRASDPVLQRVVAVKVLAPHLARNAVARRRFVREAQAMAAVCHDHVLPIYAIESPMDQPRIVMQFVHGRSLQNKLDDEGPLPVREIVRIAMQTASGLAAAHAQGLVHRDVKPSNILLENGIERVRLTDFGLALAADEACSTSARTIAGTPQYMSPEQARGESVDSRSDLFSLGCVMYAMCTGHSPFTADTVAAALHRVCDHQPRSVQDWNPDIPDWLIEIIDQLLKKSPEDRNLTARQLTETLEQALARLQHPRTPPAPTDHEPAVSGPPPDIPGLTILFRPISARLALVFLLLGMVGAIVNGVQKQMPIGELFVTSILIGLLTSFWGTFVFASLQFFIDQIWRMARNLSRRSKVFVAPGAQRRTHRG